MLSLSKTKDLNTDNNRQICSRSSADQNWQSSAACYNAHKALNDGNREIGKPNMVSCHHPSLPPSVSQQMLCTMKTLSAAQEWAEICWQWRWVLEDTDKKKETKNFFVKVGIWVYNDDTLLGRRAECECTHRPFSSNRTYIPMETHCHPSPTYYYYYSIHIHSRTCQLQARRCLSPDGGKLHNSLICLWPLKECLKASPIPSGRHQ